INALMTTWANSFFEVPDALAENDEVREISVELVDSEPIHAKAVEGGDREEQFREILRAFLGTDLTYEEATERVRTELPRSESPHSHETSTTFNKQWVDRLVRSEGNRFYNHAVLLVLQDSGEERCYIPSFDDEDRQKKCTSLLAETEQSVDEMLENMRRAYRDEEWGSFPRIPYKP
ncbi:hypothetical protein, partial [Halorubrum sp. Atlit-26R]|uniref:hypothetical protein n=1 Tax=Halorubrum sp. Atlit-26R TaxID=2282128 RepID=UPI001F404A55